MLQDLKGCKLPCIIRSLHFSISGLHTAELSQACQLINSRSLAKIQHAKKNYGWGNEVGVGLRGTEPGLSECYTNSFTKSGCHLKIWSLLFNFTNFPSIVVLYLKIYPLDILVAKTLQSRLKFWGRTATIMHFMIYFYGYFSIRPTPHNNL